MMRRSLFVLAGLSLLGLGLMTAWAQTELAKDDVSKLVGHDAKYIQDTLAKPTLDKKNQRRVKLAAFLIASYAQHGNLPELRDKALALVKAVDGDKLADAKSSRPS